MRWKKKSCKLYESSGRFEEMSKLGGVVNGMKAVNIISVNLQWLIFKNLEIGGKKICKLGAILQAHVGNCPVADF